MTEPTPVCIRCDRPADTPLAVLCESCREQAKRDPIRPLLHIPDPNPIWRSMYRTDTT